MKKVLALVLAAIMCFALVACGGGQQGGEEQYEIVMLFDNKQGSIDDGSFCEGAWNGVERYIEEKGVQATYFAPTEETTDAYLSIVEQAVGVGAKFIICPGYLFEEAIYVAADQYPEVNFILLDGRPHNADYTEYKTAENVYSVLFAEEESGFLAGYAAVNEGFRNLAFFGGMAVTSVARFGYGYCEGAEYAAKELGLNKGDVKIKYWYSGDFLPNPEKLTTVTGWYESGTEVIFSCGGSICDNAFAAAEATGNVAIGVDIDQAAESDVVITSAMKHLENAVYDALTADEFPGGTDATLGASVDCIGLPTNEESWRFENFTIEQYEAIYAKLKNDENGLATNLLTDADINEPTEIPLELVELEYIQ